MHWFANAFHRHLARFLDMSELELNFTTEEKKTMDVIQAKKAKFETQRLIILKQLEEVESKITELQSEYGAIHNRRNPLLTLPNEVTCLIFDNAQLPASAAVAVVDEELHMEVVVSHVCRHWRTLALGYSKLWARFGYTSEPTLITVARFEAYMVRSVSQPLRLWFDFRGFPSNPFSPDLFFKAVQHLNRWQHFTLYTEERFRDTTRSLAEFQTISAPMLESLFLFLNPDYDDEDDIDSSYLPVTDLRPTIFGGGTPKLSFVRLHDPTVFHILPPLSNLSTLWLNKSTSEELPRFSTQAFIDLLSLPSLEHVLFDGDFCESAHLLNRIEMPNLKRLYFSDFIAFWSFLPNIRAPRLETLMMFNCEFDAATPDPTLLDRSYRFPALRKLCIVDSEMIPEMAANFTALTSQATEVLITHDSVPQSMLTTIVEELDKERVWPRLKTLICNIEGCTEIDPYLTFAKGRPKKSFKFKLHPYLLSHWEDTEAEEYHALQRLCEIEEMDEEEWVEQEMFWPRDMDYPSCFDLDEEDNPCFINSNY